MIIVSQDKTNVINFANVGNLYADEKKILCTDIQGCYLAKLGTYKTEERAKEVLLEIVKKYGEYVSLENMKNGINAIYNIPKAYEMPEV